MGKYADERGRFRFAPSTLNGTLPYVDRLQIQAVIPLPFMTWRHGDAFLRYLTADGSLFQSPYARECKLQRHWLFAGSAKLSGNGEGGCQLTIFLSLNPTRFLQAYRVPNTLAERSILAEDAPAAMRIWGDAEAALQEAASRTFDRNDNFLTHLPNSYGLIGQWDERLREYLQSSFVVLDVALERAYLRQVGRPLNAPLSAASWSLRQVECYWEFAVPDALHKMSAIAPTALSVLRDSYERLYPVGEADRGAVPERGAIRNAPYVAGRLMREDVRAKLYAKSWNVLRFEVAYDAQPLRAVGPSGIDIARTGDLQNLLRALACVRRDAMSRGRLFWEEFWQRHDATGPASPERLVSLVRIVNSVAEEADIPADCLMSLLLELDGGQPLSADRRDPVRRLVARGVLRRTPTSSPRNTRYMTTPSFRPVVAALRDALRAVGSVQSDLAPDEDPPSRRRLRLRTRALEALPPRYRPRRRTLARLPSA